MYKYLYIIFSLIVEHFNNKEKEFTLKKQKTIKEKLHEFILKYDNPNNPVMIEEKENKLLSSSSSVYSKKDKKIGELRSNILYEKGLIKNELIKMIYEKNNEIKSINELKDCTFKPITLKSSKTFKSLNVEKEKDKVKSLYDRNIYWKNKNNERIIKEKSMRESDSQHTFKPKVKCFSNFFSCVKIILIMFFMQKKYLII